MSDKSKGLGLFCTVYVNLKKAYLYFLASVRYRCHSYILLLPSGYQRLPFNRSLLPSGYDLSVNLKKVYLYFVSSMRNRC